MPTSDVTDRFAALEDKQGPEEYNLEHFRSHHLLADGQRTIRSSGIPPGEEAPDFELPRVDGGSLRLSSLRGGPVLLRFGSIT